MDTLDQLTELDDQQEKTADDGHNKPFKHLQEEAIISLALDHPEFFASVISHIKPQLFSRLETALVIAELLNLYEKFDIIPSRGILKDHMESKITVDDPYEEILRLIERKSDYREVPIVKDLLLQWARQKAFGLIYKKDAIDAYQEGNYTYIQKILDDANRIVDVGDSTGLWLFENLDIIFEPDLSEHRTTGFPRLDKLLNNGGPSPKEVLCWLAPTNVGKCISLQSKIIEKNLSRIYRLELEDGQVFEIAGFRRVQTTRGMVRVCDLTDEDEVTATPTDTDRIEPMSDLRIHDEHGCSYQYYDDTFA
jgi:hypothetical protein